MKNYATSANPQSGSESPLGTFARNTLNTVHEVVDEGKAVAKDQFDATAKWVGDTTKTNPMRALGIVAAASFFIGLLLARR
ncbi:MAG TPA: hypothetical protein VK642_15775 [Burkholderiales bacterium]|nr:hypothetical protein [Burkholderiales bacterium]